MGEEVNHSAVRVDITPHARDYLNLVSQLAENLDSGNYSDRGFLQKAGTGGGGSPCTF